MDVIVIGAGAAGLAAARELARHSLRVAILEARDRIGGRVWPVPFGDSVAPAELGAEFIHGKARETRALLREAGAGLTAIGDESWSGDGKTELQRTDDFGSAAAIFEPALSLHNDESVENFLSRFDGRDDMRESVASARAFVEGFDAADPRIASVRSIAAELHSGVDSTAARPIGGYAPLLKVLLGDCRAAGVDVRLSTIVHRVARGSGSCTIEATDASGNAVTMRARATIVTLPAGVLNYRGEGTRVDFEPELSPEKRSALASIVMGPVVKVTLRFGTPVWEATAGGRYRDAAFFRSSVHAFPSYWTQFPQRSRLITAWAGGPQAAALRGLTSGDFIERAVNGFGSLLNDRSRITRWFEAGIVHDWDADPFARGAYSYLAVGGANARTALARPAGDALFFAGEATSNDGQGGTVNGALETGLRAAREAAAAIERQG